MNNILVFLPEVGLPYYLSVNGEILTDDGYRPFSNDDFSLEWSTDKVTITYGFGSGDIQKVKFLNCNKMRTYNVYFYNPLMWENLISGEY